MSISNVRMFTSSGLSAALRTTVSYRREYRHFIHHRPISSHSAQDWVLTKMRRAIRLLPWVAQMDVAPPTPAQAVIAALMALTGSERLLRALGGKDDITID